MSVSSAASAFVTISAICFALLFAEQVLGARVDSTFDGVQRLQSSGDNDAAGVLKKNSALEPYFSAAAVRRSRGRSRRKFIVQESFSCAKCSSHGFCRCANSDCTQGSCDCFNDARNGYWKGLNCDDCVLGFAGPGCLVECEGGSCNACNGNGICLQGVNGDGSCSCFLNAVRGFWTGKACDTCAPKYFGAKCRQSCPGINDADGLECYGRGRCRSDTGTCICDRFADQGWGNATGCLDCDDIHYGTFCNMTCAGNTSDGRPCSGHGRCFNGTSGNGTCVCDKGWGTADCSVQCPNFCSNRGDCLDGADRSATCECDGLWAKPNCSSCVANVTGPSCSDPCPIVFNRTTGYGAVCNDAGRCVFDGVSAKCECIPGYEGSLCTLACPGSPPCSGHGTCRIIYSGESQSAVCSCANNTNDGFWTGDTCNRCAPAYNGSASCKVACPIGSNGQICSGHGTCNNGACECIRNEPGTTLDYCGVACETATPYTGVACSVNCQGCESVYCHEMFKFGVLCENTCPGVNRALNFACSGHGFCSEGRLGTGRCTCSPGYTGSACTRLCPVNSQTGEPCSGAARGTCTFRADPEGLTNDVALCTCNDGFTGTACESTCPFVAGVVCSGHGTCLPNSAQCQCTGAWTGRACNVPCACDLKNGRCDEDVCRDLSPFFECKVCRCNGNFTGLCDRCMPGYQGPRCEGLCINGETVGTTCLCFANYSTPTCGKRCANDTNGIVCGGHGRCQAGSTNSGDCRCDAEWYGPACEKRCTRDLCAAAPYNLVNPQCNAQTGECECLDDSSGHFTVGSGACDVCATGYWGPSCTEKCECSGNGWCDMNTGECNCYDSADLGHWRGASCTQCAEGFIGQRCERKSVLITRLVGRNITRSIDSFDRTDTLSIGIENDMFNFGGKTVLFAGGKPLALFDVSGEEMIYLGNTNSTEPTVMNAFGCVNETGEVVHAFSSLSANYFVVQPTPNCTSRWSIRVVKASFLNGTFSVPAEFGTTTSRPNPLVLSDVVPDITTRTRVVAAVAQTNTDPATVVQSDKTMLVMLIADFDLDGHQLPGGRIVRLGLDTGDVLTVIPSSAGAAFYLSDVALSPFDPQSDQIIAVSGQKVVDGVPSWDVEVYTADTLLVFFTERSIKERARCFPKEFHNGLVAGECARCINAAKVRFFGDSLVIAMVVNSSASSTAGTSSAIKDTDRTTVLMWLTVVQHAADDTPVIVYDTESFECLSGRIAIASDGTANFAYDRGVIQLQQLITGSCTTTQGQTHPCDTSVYSIQAAPTDLANMVPSSLVVDMRPDMPAFAPQSGVVYVAVRSTFSAQLSALTKFSLDQEDFGLYGNEELRLTSSATKSDIPEVFTAMAIAPRQRILYAVASGVSKIRIASFLLYEIHTLEPNIADQRGGTNITLQGLGFFENDNYRIMCAFEEVGTSPVRYELTEAFNVSYTQLVCRAPTQNSTSVASACEGQKVEASLFSGRWLTQNRQAVQRVQRPFLLRGGVTPDRGSMSTSITVTVRGAGFVKSIYSRCKFYSDNPLASEVLFSTVTYVNPNEVLCQQPTAQFASYDKSYIDISLDGQLYSVDTPPEYQIVGEATNILTPQSVIEVRAQNETGFSATIWIVDSQRHQLGALDTEARKVMLFSNISESECDPRLFDWRRPTDGFPWPPCRNLTLNASKWGGNSDTTMGVLAYFNFTEPGIGQLTFRNFFFERPRVGRVVITFGTPDGWRTNTTIVFQPGTAFGLAIANLEDFGDGSRASKFYVQRQSPLSQIDIIVVDFLGNIIDTDVQRYQVSVAFYYIRDDTKQRIDVKSSTPVFRVENNRITFPDIYLEYLHGVSHYVEFSSPGLRPVTTPAIRTQGCARTEYKVSMGSECKPCPPVGAECDGTEKVTVLPGFWRSNGSNIDIYECKGGATVCPGSGSAPSGSNCSEGYTGPMCSLCAQGYGKSGVTSCTKCQSEDSTTGAVVGIAFAFLVIVLGWVTFTLRKDEVTEISIIIRTVVNHLQAAGELGEFSTQWSPFVRRLFEIQAAGSSPSLSGVQSLDCMLKQTGSSYTTVFAIYMSLPGVSVMLGLFVFIVVRVLKLKPVITKALREEIHRDIEAIGQQARTAILLHRYPLYMVVITSLCVTMFTLYQTLIAQSTSVLKCKDIVVGYREVQEQFEDGTFRVSQQPINERYMLIDMSLNCDSDEYRTLYTAALICAVVYGFGIPVAFVFGYKFVNARIAKPELTKLMFTFLIGGYKEQFWFWQAIIMIRKLVLVLVIVFVDNRQLQSYCAMWAMSVALILQIWFNPNEKPEHNRVEAISLAMITVTLNLSLLYFWPDMPPAGNDVLTAVLIFLAFGAFVVFGYFLYQPVKEAMIEVYSEVLVNVRQFTEEKRKANAERPRFSMPELFLDKDDDDEDWMVRTEPSIGVGGGAGAGGSAGPGARRPRAGFSNTAAATFSRARNRDDHADFDEVELNAYDPPPPVVMMQDDTPSARRRGDSHMFRYDDL